MEYSLPVLLQQIKVQILKDILIEAKCGLWSESGDIESIY